MYSKPTDFALMHILHKIQGLSIRTPILRNFPEPKPLSSTRPLRQEKFPKLSTRCGNPVNKAVKQVVSILTLLARAMMTLPRLARLLFIFCVSFSRCPCDPDSFRRSLPARSIRFNIPASPQTLSWKQYSLISPLIYMGSFRNVVMYPHATILELLLQDITGYATRKAPGV